MTEYRFTVPATVYFSVRANSESDAREIAEQWQHHAARWEQFAEATDIGEFLDVPEELGGSVDGSAMAYIETATAPDLRWAAEVDQCKKCGRALDTERECPGGCSQPRE